MLDNLFVVKAQRVSGHLRIQQNWVSEMKTKCPEFVGTLWLSMGRFIGLACEALNCCAGAHGSKKTPCKYDKSWWVIVYVIPDYTDTVNIKFRSLQGLTTLV